MSAAGEDLHAEDLPGWRDPAGRAAWARALLLGSAALSAVLCVSDILIYRFYLDYEAGRFASEAAAVEAELAHNARHGLLAIAFMVVAFSGSILSLTWLYRAARNCRALGATGMEILPGWAVGWYFVPFANLWKPYQAMKEIWFASENPGTWRYGPAPQLFTIWWTCFVIANLLANFSFRLSWRAETLEQFKRATLASIGSAPFDIAATILFIVIMNRVTRMQLEQREFGAVF